MALLDQLFRLRGAPRAPTPPVTLGALVAALKDVPPETSGPDVSAVTAGTSSGDRARDDAGSIEAAAQSVPVFDPAQGESRPADPSFTPPVPAVTQRRNATRFNPFAPVAEETNAERSGAEAGAIGPCLEDPTLPPLRLKAQVESDVSERPLNLGGVLPTEGHREPVAELRQIEAPTVRLAPLKAPARPVAETAATNAKVLRVRLEIQADASLDVVAFKQYTAKFPGVLKSVISDARD